MEISDAINQAQREAREAERRVQAVARSMNIYLASKDAYGPQGAT